MTTQRADLRGLVDELLRRIDDATNACPCSGQPREGECCDTCELLDHIKTHLVANRIVAALSAPGEPVAMGIVTAGYDGPSVVFPASDADDKVLSGLVSQRVYIYLSPHAHTEGDNAPPTDEHGYPHWPVGGWPTPAPVKVAASQFAKARAKLLAELRATALALDSGDAEVCGDVVREWVSQLEDADNADFHDRLYPAPVPVPAAEREELLGCNDPPSGSREAAMVVIERDGTGKPTVWCDPELVPIVKALNDAGIATTASCSGHGYQPGSIILANDTELRLFTFEQARAIDKMFPGINGEPSHIETMARHHVDMLLPLAKGYAAAHRHESNDRLVQAAEDYLAAPVPVPAAKP